MKVSRQVLQLRHQLMELARAELERRQTAEIDPAVVEAARQELERLYDQMARNLGLE